MHSRFHHAVQSLVVLLTRYPVQTLILWTMLTGIAGYGLRYLKFDFSPESVYSGQDQEIAFCEAHKQLFRFEDSQCLVVLESTDGRSLARADCMNWLREVGDKAREIDGVQGVTSLMTLQRPQIRLDGDRDALSDQLEWVQLVSPRDLASQEQLDDRLRRLPLLNDLLISEDRQLLLLLISDGSESTSMDGIRPRVAAIEQLLNQIQPPTGTRIRLSGVPPIRVDIIRSLQADQRLMVPLCTIVFIVLAIRIFRSISVTAISLFAVGSSVLMTVGIMGWTNQTFNLLSNVVPPLSLIIAAANSVHIVSRLQVVLLNNPVERVTSRSAEIAAAVQKVIGEMMVTCFLTLATTAIGFGSLWLAKSELLQSLAVQAVNCHDLQLLLPADRSRKRLTLTVTLWFDDHHNQFPHNQFPHSRTQRSLPKQQANRLRNLRLDSGADTPLVDSKSQTHHRFPHCDLHCVSVLDTRNANQCVHV